MFFPLILLFLKSFKQDTFEYAKPEKKFNMGRMVDSSPYKSQFKYNNQVVVTDVEECSKIGENVLENNGTAVDASIAALICLGVHNPHSSGIGGGGFMLIHQHNNTKPILLDFRETAPRCSHKNMVNSSQNLLQGGIAVAIPGEIAGYYRAWKEYGKYSWKKLFQPSINILKTGFPVGRSLAIALDIWRETIKKEPSLRELFTKDGKVIKEKMLFKNPKLAKFLELISNRNGEIFYKNITVVNNMVNEIKEQGGCIESSDFNNYKVKIKPAIKFSFDNKKIIVPPAPTSGPIIALVLKILQNFNLTETVFKKNPVIVYQRILEALKYGYGLRTQLADPDFEIIANITTKNILNSTYIKHLYEEIGFKTKAVSHYLKIGHNQLKTGTTHLVVLDKFGNCVSTTSTINGYFGAKFSSKEYGFVYNNEMDDFSFPKLKNEYNLPHSPYNYPENGKRPQSSASPIIILDKDKNVIFAAGGSGGSMIISSVAQVTINYLLLGMNLKNSIDSPRLHTQLTPDIVYLEDRFPHTIGDNLTRYGFKVEYNSIHHAVVQALSRSEVEEETSETLSDTRTKIVINKKTLIYGESDFRKGGKPSGL